MFFFHVKTWEGNKPQKVSIVGIRQRLPHLPSTSSMLHIFINQAHQESTRSLVFRKANLDMKRFPFCQTASALLSSGSNFVYQVMEGTESSPHTAHRAGGPAFVLLAAATCSWLGGLAIAPRSLAHLRLRGRKGPEVCRLCHLEDALAEMVIQSHSPVYKELQVNHEHSESATKSLRNIEAARKRTLTIACMLGPS